MNDFDEKARDWDKNKMHQERTLAVAGILKEKIAAGNRIKALEFGAGTGLLSFYLKDLFSEITLMDSSAEMLNMARQKMEPADQQKLNTVFFDLEKEEYKGETFDVIYSQMALHHVKDTALIAGRFYRMLKPGGLLAIADLYEEDGSFHDGDTSVHPGFDPAFLKNLLQENGFHGTSIVPCFVIRKEISENRIVEYPVFLLTSFR